MPLNPPSQSTQTQAPTPTHPTHPNLFNANPSPNPPSSLFRALVGNHGIIASKRCDHVTIANNHVSYGVNTGIFLHRSSDHAIVSGNHVHNNGDAGLAVLESFYMDVHDNVFKDNRYGIRFSVGAGYNWVSAACRRMFCGCSIGGDLRGGCRLFLFGRARQLATCLRSTVIRYGSRSARDTIG